MTNHYRHAIRHLAPLLALGWCALASAGTLTDPTRPPDAWLAAQGSYVTDDDASSGQVLLLGRTRRFAVIDGQLVKPGDTLNGAKVLAIRPNGVVVVEENAEPQLLKLTPAIEKKSTTSRPQNAQGRTSKRTVLLNGNGGNE